MFFEWHNPLTLLFQLAQHQASLLILNLMEQIREIPKHGS